MLITHSLSCLKDGYGFFGLRNVLVGDSRLFVWVFNCPFKDLGLKFKSTLCITDFER